MKFLLWSLFFMLPEIACAQKSTAAQMDREVFNCTYRFTFKPDSLSANKYVEYMSLKIGKNTSLFRSKGTQMSDSLLSYALTLPFNQTNGDLIKQKMESLPHTRFSYSIYKNSAKGEVYYYDFIGVSIYRYLEPSPLFIWHFTQSTAIISGYKCQKATTTWRGRIFEAWFSRQIPVSEGPFKFYGLPGLIIKIQDTRSNYCFELTNLVNAKSNYSIVFPIRSYIATTRKDFLKGSADFNYNFTSRAAAMHITM